MWISFFTVVFSLGLFPLDCFIPSSDSSGALGRARDRTFQPLALKQGLELTALQIQQQMNPAQIPMRGVNPALFTSQIRGGGRYSHKDTERVKYLPKATQQVSE